MKQPILALAALAAFTGAASHSFAMAETPSRTTSPTSAWQANPSEAEHRRATLNAGMLAQESSRIALEKSSNPIVRQFAQAEINEQTTLAEIFTSMQPSATPVALSGPETERLAQLRTATGKQFEKQYLAIQLDAHKQLLDAQESYLNNATNTEQANIAKLARGQIREHMLLLTTYQLRTQ